MLQKLLILAAIALAFAHPVIAQKPTFLPGYMVTIEGDTLRGLIQDLPFSGNYDSCLFKTQVDSNPLPYHPAKLKAYQIDDRNSMVSRTIRFKETPRAVFLEVLADGKATLFHYKRYDENYYFIEKNGTDIQPLTSETVRMERGETFVYRKDNKFRFILTKLFADCGTILSQIDHALLQEKSLTKLVDKYNHCVGSYKVAPKKQPSTVLNLGILGGVNSSTYTENAPDGSYGFHGPYYATTYEIGAFLELNSVRPGLGRSFRVDLVYFGPHYVASGTLANAYHEATIDVQQLKLPLTYKYTWSSKKFSPYILLGVSIAYTLSVESQMTVTSPPLGEQHYQDWVPKRIAFGYFGGLGVMTPLSEKLRIFLEVRAEQAFNNKSWVALTGIRF